MQICENKKIVCIRKESNPHRICLEHQHSRRFIVLELQYGRRDVMWKPSMEPFGNSEIDYSREDATTCLNNGAKITLVSS